MIPPPPHHSRSGRGPRRRPRRLSPAALLFLAIPILSVAAPTWFSTPVPLAAAAGITGLADLSPKLRDSLSERVSDDAQDFIAAEEEKKAEGKRYTDLQPRFQYLPSRSPGHGVTVSVKLGGAEYQPPEKGQAKGRATGRLRYLVLRYVLKNGKWQRIGSPRWETQTLGKAAAKKMTEVTRRAEKAREELGGGTPKSTRP